MRIFTGEYGIIDGSLCGSYPIYRNANLIEGIVILSRRFKVWLFGTRIFLICPVRNASKEQIQEIHEYVSKLEKEGYKVYWPYLDTNQKNDNIGFRICTDNKKAIKRANEIHIFWDKDSQGSLFDLGMAFAFKKQIIIANRVEETPTKSFANMVKYWHGLGDTII